MKSVKITVFKFACLAALLVSVAKGKDVRSREDETPSSQKISGEWNRKARFLFGGFQGEQPPMGPMGPMPPYYMPPPPNPYSSPSYVTMPWTMLQNTGHYFMEMVRVVASAAANSLAYEQENQAAAYYDDISNGGYEGPGPGPNGPEPGYDYGGSDYSGYDDNYRRFPPRPLTQGRK